MNCIYSFLYLFELVVDLLILFYINASSPWSRWWSFNICTGNGLASNKQQAIANSAWIDIILKVPVRLTDKYMLMTPQKMKQYNHIITMNQKPNIDNIDTRSAHVALR